MAGPASTQPRPDSVPVRPTYWVRPGVGPAAASAGTQSGVIPPEIQGLIATLGTDVAPSVSAAVFDVLSGNVQYDIRMGLTGTLRIGEERVKIDQSLPQYDALIIFIKTVYDISKITKEGSYFDNSNYENIINKFVEAYITLFNQFKAKTTLTLHERVQLKKYAKAFEKELQALGISFSDVTDTNLLNPQFKDRFLSALVTVLKGADKNEYAMRILGVKTNSLNLDKIRELFQLIKEGKAMYGFKQIYAARKIITRPVEIDLGGGKKITITSGVYDRNSDLSGITLLGKILVKKGLLKENPTIEDIYAAIRPFTERYLDGPNLLLILTKAKYDRHALFVGRKGSPLDIRVYFSSKSGKIEEASFVVKIDGKTVIKAEAGKITELTEDSSQLDELQMLLARAGFTSQNIFENILAFQQTYGTEISGVKEEDVRATASIRDINLAQANSFNRYLSDAIGKDGQGRDREEKTIDHLTYIMSRLANNPLRSIILKGIVGGLSHLKAGGTLTLGAGALDAIVAIFSGLPERSNDAVDYVQVFQSLFNAYDKQGSEAPSEATMMLAESLKEVINGLPPGTEINIDDLINACGIALYGAGNRTSKNIPTEIIVQEEVKEIVKSRDLKAASRRELALTEKDEIQEVAVNSSFIAALERVIAKSKQAVRQDIPLALAIKYSPVVDPEVLADIKGADKVKDPFKIIVAYIKLMVKKNLIEGLPEGFVLRLEAFANGGDALDFADTQVLLNLMSNTAEIVLDVLKEAVKSIDKPSDMLPVWDKYLLSKKPILIMLDKAGNYGAVEQTIEAGTKKIIVSETAGEVSFAEVSPEELADQPRANLIAYMYFVSPQYLSPEQYILFVKHGIISSQLTPENINGIAHLFDERYYFEHVLDESFYAGLKALEGMRDGQVQLPILMGSGDVSGSSAQISLSKDSAEGIVLRKLIISMRELSVGLGGKPESQIYTSIEYGSLVKIQGYLALVLEKPGDFKGRAELKTAKDFIDKMLTDASPITQALDPDDVLEVTAFAADLKAGKYGPTTSLSYADESEIPKDIPNREEFVERYKIVQRVLRGLAKATFVEPEKPTNVLARVAHGFTEGAARTRASQDLSLFSRPADGVLPLLKFVFFGGEKAEVDKIQAIRTRATQILGETDSPTNMRDTEIFKDRFEVMRTEKKDPKAELKIDEVLAIIKELKLYLSSDELKQDKNLGVKMLVHQLLVDLNQYLVNFEENVKRVEFDRLILEIATRDIDEEEKKSGKPLKDKEQKIKDRVVEYKQIHLSMKAQIELEGLIKKSKLSRDEEIKALLAYTWDGSRPELEDLLKRAMKPEDYEDAKKRETELKKLVEGSKQLKKERYAALQQLAEHEEQYEKYFKDINVEKNKQSHEYSKLAKYFTGNEVDLKLWQKIETELAGAFESNFGMLQTMSGGSFVTDVAVEENGVRTKKTIRNGQEVIKFIRGRLGKKGWIDASTTPADKEDVTHAKQMLNMVLSTLPTEPTIWNPASGGAVVATQAAQMLGRIGPFASYGVVGAAQAILGMFANRETGPKTWEELKVAVNEGRTGIQAAQTASSMSVSRTAARQNISQIFNAMFEADPVSALSPDNYQAKRTIGASAVIQLKKQLEAQRSLIKLKPELRREYEKLIRSKELDLNLMDDGRYADVLAKLTDLIAYLQKNSRLPLFDPMHAPDLAEVTDPKIRLAMMYVAFLAIDFPVIQEKVLFSQSIPTETEGVVGYNPKKFLRTIGYENGEIRISVTSPEGNTIRLAPIKRERLRSPLVDAETRQGIADAFRDVAGNPVGNFEDTFVSGAFEGANFAIMPISILSGLSSYVGDLLLMGRDKAASAVTSDDDEAKIYELKMGLRWKNVSTEAPAEAGAFSQWEVYFRTPFNRAIESLKSGNMGYAIGYGVIGFPIAIHILLNNLKFIKVMADFSMGRPVAWGTYHDYGMVMSLPLTSAQKAMALLQDRTNWKREKGKALVRKSRQKAAAAQKEFKKHKSSAKYLRLQKEARELALKGERLIREAETKRTARKPSKGPCRLRRAIGSAGSRFERIYDPVRRAVVIRLKRAGAYTASRVPDSVKRPIKGAWHHPAADAATLITTRVYRPNPIQGVRQDVGTIKQKRHLMEEYGFKTYAEAADYMAKIEHAQETAARRILTDHARRILTPERFAQLRLADDGFLRIHLNAQELGQVLNGQPIQKVSTAGLSSGEFARVAWEAQGNMQQAYGTAQKELDSKLGLTPKSAQPVAPAPTAAATPAPAVEKPTVKSILEQVKAGTMTPEQAGHAIADADVAQTRAALDSALKEAGVEIDPAKQAELSRVATGRLNGTIRKPAPTAPVPAPAVPATPAVPTAPALVAPVPTAAPRGAQPEIIRFNFGGKTYTVPAEQFKGATKENPLKVDIDGKPFEIYFRRGIGSDLVESSTFGHRIFIREAVPKSSPASPEGDFVTAGPKLLDLDTWIDVKASIVKSNGRFQAAHDPSTEKPARKGPKSPKTNPGEAGFVSPSFAKPEPISEKEITMSMDDVEKTLQDPQVVKRLVEYIRTNPNVKARLQTEEGKKFLRDLQEYASIKTGAQHIKITAGGLLVGFALMIGVDKFIQLLGIKNKKTNFVLSLGIAHLANLRTQEALVRFAVGKDAAQAQKILHALQYPTKLARVARQFKNLFGGLFEMAFVSMVAGAVLDKAGITDPAVRSKIEMGVSFIAPAGIKLYAEKASVRIGRRALIKAGETAITRRAASAAGSQILANVGVVGAGRLLVGVGAARFVTNDMASMILDDYELSVARRVYQDIQTWRVGNSHQVAAFAVEFFHGIGGAASEWEALKGCPEFIKEVVQHDIRNAEEQRAALHTELRDFLARSGDLSLLTQPVQFGVIGETTFTVNTGLSRGMFLPNGLGIDVIGDINKRTVSTNPIPEKDIYEYMVQVSQQKTYLTFGTPEFFAEIIAKYDGRITEEDCQRILEKATIMSWQARFAELRVINPSLLPGFETSQFNSDIRAYFTSEGVLREDKKEEFIAKFLGISEPKKSEGIVNMLASLFGKN